MNYELCLKLKQAGFYQRYDYSPHQLRRYYIADGIVINLEQVQKMYDLEGKHPYLNDVLTYIPTLEELISACGDGFYKLYNHKDCVPKWEVNDDKCCQGLIPEESVANLFLKLHETNNK